MVPIEITGMRPQGENWLILGWNFTPFCQVTEDGRRLDTEYVSPRLLRVTEDLDIMIS